jgi:CheY-like chemotaxis protein
VNVAASTHPTGARILLVDDDALFLEGISRALACYGYQTCKAYNGREASDLVAARSFDTVIADVRMPDMDGIELLTALRRQDDDLPVILITASPDVNSAAEAVALRAFAYLTKPVDMTELRRVIGRAIHAAGMARIKRQALLLASEGGLAGGEYPWLEQSFRRALDTLWMAYQPIVRAADRSLFGYEALLRSDEKTLPDPEAVLGAAERLDRLPKLGQKIWAAAAGTFSGAEDHALLFVNLHAADLWDPMLASPSAPLVAMADRVVLEVTERASIDNVDAAREARRASCPGWIAIDDPRRLRRSHELRRHGASVREARPDRSRRRPKPHEAKIISSFTRCATTSPSSSWRKESRPRRSETFSSTSAAISPGYLFAKPGRPFPQFTW